MAGRPVVEVKGARQLRRTLRAAGADLSDLKDAHAQAAKIAAAAAASRAPVLTGALKADIRPSGTQTAAILRAGRARIRYAGPIHYGWPARGIEPRPFMTEGAQATEPVWMGIYERAVDAALAKVEGTTDGST